MDAATIAAAQLQDRRAQAALLTSLQDGWYRLCLGLLGDADAARDATQETALRFLRQLSRFAGQSRLETWAFGIAINVVREMRRQRRGVFGLDVDRPEPGPSPDRAAEKGESGELVRAVVAELPPRQREAIVLRFFEELSVDETAAAMDCSPGTVKATVHQALRQLRRRLPSLI